jgi:hypothetical protein
VGLIRKDAWSVAAVAMLVAWCPAAARAQDESLGDVAAARKLAVAGIALADAGNCPEAIDKLSRSEKIHHAISVLGRLGECQVQLGKIVDGTENLRRVVREQLAPDAPLVFVTAQARAQRVLADALPKIARLTIAITVPAGVSFWVTVDGVNVPTANLDTERLVDPGDHVIGAGGQGYLKAEGKVHVDAGRATSISLTLSPDPNASTAAAGAQPATAVAPQAPAATTGAPAVTQAEAPPRPAAGNHVPAYIAGAVGLVGVGVGIVFGMAATNDKSDLDHMCKAMVCPPSAQSTLDAGTRNGTISTVGFVIGGLGLAGGAVLYFVDFGAHTPERRAEGAGGVRVGGYVSPAGAGIGGSF